MIICDWGYANYRRLTSGKCWDALIASIDSIKWIIFSSNYIDFLLISKWSENGQRSRLQTIFSAKGPIYRRSVSIITSIISSFRLSFMLNSVLYHTNWPSKSTCIAIRLIQKQKCIIQEKLYSTVNWGTSMYNYGNSLLYQRTCSKSISLGLWLFQNAMFSVIAWGKWCELSKWLFSKAALPYHLDFLTSKNWILAAIICFMTG